MGRTVLNNSRITVCVELAKQSLRGAVRGFGVVRFLAFMGGVVAGFSALA